jgi:hypothetical protein
LEHKQNFHVLLTPQTTNTTDSLSIFIKKWLICYNLLTPYYHPKSTVCIRIHTVGFDKCIMTCVQHCSIFQTSFTALKYSKLFFIPLCPLTLLLSLQFCLFWMSNSWNHKAMQLFQIVLFPFLNMYLRFLHDSSWLDK